MQSSSHASKEKMRLKQAFVIPQTGYVERPHATYSERAPLIGAFSSTQGGVSRPFLVCPSLAPSRVLRLRTARRGRCAPAHRDEPGQCYAR